MQISYIDGPRFRRALLAACEYARRERAELNRINVFPVPDGDTGTNLALTLQAIADHLRGEPHRDLGAVASRAAHGAVVGARGNCGMMLSHFLLGFAESVASRVRIGTTEFGLALSAGSDKLHAALERPVEGTILTVMRDAAAAARQSENADFVPLVSEVVAEARRSLARTPELLPVLREAGVVDAGAKGFVSLLEGVLLFVRGDRAVPVPVDLSGAPPAVSSAGYGVGGEHFRFCTEALVRGSGLPTQESVREALGALGDSLIAIRAGDVLKVHVHADEPDRVFDYLKGLGTLVTHKAEDMHAQRDTIERAVSGHVRLARRPVTVVTDSACDLPEEVIRAHGIQLTPLTLVEGDRTYRDGIDISAAEYHARLLDDGELPTTSQPTPAAFLETYGRALEEGEAVVGVLVGSTLSGTFGAAEVAAGRIGGRGRIHLADSLGASLLEGLLALKAAELAELGRAPELIVDEIERVRGRSGLLFTVQNLDRLLASGRVGRGAALVGRFLSVKPILGFQPDGSIAAFGNVFGSRRARSELLRILRRQIPPGTQKLRFGIVHVGFSEIVDDVTERLRTEYGQGVEIMSAPATPVIATHLGLGAWGVAYLRED